MRGEKDDGSALPWEEQGSPPHARGKADPTGRFRLHEGITPACAGKRAAKLTASVAGRDHPRMRGEKFKGLSAKETAAGSPPHARGKAEILRPVSAQIRITPACAGKSGEEIRD